MQESQLRTIKHSLAKFASAIQSTDALSRLGDQSSVVAEALREAQMALGALDMIPIEENSYSKNTRDTIRNVVEEIEIIQSYVEHKIAPTTGKGFIDRLQDAKRTMDEINKQIQ